MNLKALAAAATLLLTAACTFNLRPGAEDADAPAAESMQRMEMVARLTYRERIALPADAVVRTRFYQIDESGAHRISSYDSSLDGRQVPIPLELGFRHSAGDDALLTMRSQVFLDDDLLRDTGPVLLDARRRSADLGELQLLTPAQLGLDKDSADLSMPQRASGNEPGWMLQIEDDERHARLVRDYGQVEDSLQILQHSREGDLVQVFARGKDTGMVATFYHRICRDSATGMPHPWHASVQTLDGGTLNGCGGSPQSLLTGAEWQIEQIGDVDVPDEIDMTLLFDDENRLSGQSACNRYFADYRLGGESLEIKQPGATLMACAEPQMELERAFFERLPEIRRFDISADGKLLLKSTDGGSADIVAARPEGEI